MKAISSFFVLALLTATAAHAQPQGSSKLVTINKKVIGETVIPVTVGTYTPPLPVSAVNHSQARQDTPENAATALFSAMAAGDYERWLGVYSAPSRAMMVKRYQDSGRKPADVVANWKGTLTTRPVVILGRADFRQHGATYALVRYRMTMLNEMTLTDKVTGKTTPLGTKHLEIAMPFRLNQGKWEATQELAADPLFHQNHLLWEDSKSDLDLRRPAK